MGLPPPNYSNKTLLPEPIQKKTVLPVQGGGALQSGGAKPDEKELIIECNDTKSQLHYVKEGRLAEPLGDKVIYIKNTDQYDTIEKKSIKYFWVNTEKCYNEALIPILNIAGEVLKDGGTVIFIDYTPDLEITPDLLNDVTEEFKKKAMIETVKHEWNISIVKAIDYEFILGFNDGTNDLIPTNLILFKLLSEESEPTEPTIKLAIGFRVRNPEKVKDKIRELDFTPSEELLFKRLGFDKPYIRNYITKPEATQEESDASKDAFFNFWKSYVLMDGTSQLRLMTNKESQKVQGYMRDILDSYRKYLSESALQLLFHTSGKPYTPTLEGVSEDSFVFTKGKGLSKETDRDELKDSIVAIYEAVEEIDALTSHIYSLTEKISHINKSELDDKKIKTIFDIHSEIDSIAENALYNEAEKLIKSAKKASIETNLTEPMAKLKKSLEEAETIAKNHTVDAKYVVTLIPLSFRIAIDCHIISLAAKDIRTEAKKFAIEVPVLKVDDDDEDEVEEEDEEEEETLGGGAGPEPDPTGPAAAAGARILKKPRRGSTSQIAAKIDGQPDNYEYEHVKSVILNIIKINDTNYKRINSDNDRIKLLFRYLIFKFKDDEENEQFSNLMECDPATKDTCYIMPSRRFNIENFFNYLKNNQKKITFNTIINRLINVILERDATRIRYNFFKPADAPTRLIGKFSTRLLSIITEKIKEIDDD
jgi:hypothetical protein